MFSPNRLKKFSALSPGERGYFVRVVLMLAFVRVALWLVPLGTLRRYLAGVRAKPADALMGNVDVLARVARFVTSGARFVPRASCLTQALAAQALLKQETVESTLRIGVERTAQGVFRAHAWLECG